MRIFFRASTDSSCWRWRGRSRGGRSSERSPRSRTSSSICGTTASRRCRSSAPRPTCPCARSGTPSRPWSWRGAGFVVVSSRSDAPRIAVVIGAGGERPHRLRRALEALAAQELPAGELEAIVVGNHGTRAPEGPPGLPLRFIEAPAGPQGAAKNRNLGWRATRAPLVAVTDDDCRPDAGLGSRAARGGRAVARRLLPGPHGARPRGGAPALGASPARSTSSATAPGTRPATWPIRASSSSGSDGFDESYLGAGGEDTDLALRAIELGVRKAYVDEALVWHAVARPQLPPDDPRRLPASRDASGPGPSPPAAAACCRWGSSTGSHGQLLLALAGVPDPPAAAGAPDVRALPEGALPPPPADAAFVPERRPPTCRCACVADLAEVATIAARAVRSRAIAL